MPCHLRSDVAAVLFDVGGAEPPPPPVELVLTVVPVVVVGGMDAGLPLSPPSPNNTSLSMNLEFELIH